MKHLALIVLSSLLIFTSSFTHAETVINCRAKHTLFHDTDSIIAFYHFILNNNKGVVSINGKLNHDGVNTVISRNIYFNYEKITPNNYIAKSYRIAKIPADNSSDEILEKHYAPFFTQTEKKLTLNIKKGPRGSYFISFIRTPLFYCSEL